MSARRSLGVAERQHPRDVSPSYSRRRGPSNASSLRLLLQRLTALALGLTFAAFLGLFGLASITSAGTGERIIADALPSLLQTSQLVSLHSAELRAASTSSVTLPGYPVHVAWTAAEVSKNSPQALATILDARAAAVIYRRGNAAFGASGTRGSQITGPVLSGPWMLQQLFSLLNEHVHGRVLGVLSLAGAIVLVWLALFWLQVQGYGALLGIGITAIAGALLVGLASVFLWLVVELYGGGTASPVAAAAWGMAADVLWAMVVVSGVAALAGAALSATALGFAALEQKAKARRNPSLSFAGVAGRRRLG